MLPWNFSSYSAFSDHNAKYYMILVYSIKILIAMIQGSNSFLKGVMYHVKGWCSMWRELCTITNKGMIQNHRSLLVASTFHCCIYCHDAIHLGFSHLPFSVAFNSLHPSCFLHSGSLVYMVILLPANFQASTKLYPRREPYSPFQSCQFTVS